SNMHKGYLKTVVVLAVGAALGYLAATGKLNPFSEASVKAPPRETAAGKTAEPAACAPASFEAGDKAQLLSRACPNQNSVNHQQDSGKKPNLVISWRDAISWFNPSCYHGGVMGYQTPNIDRIAREGATFTDWYGQQSCTAGRAAFIMGQSPIRTGMTKVGLPGATLGIQPQDPTIAELLKPHGYVC